MAAGAGPLTLRWHEFGANLCTSSAELRAAGAFADLTIVAEGRHVAAHRFVLASCSGLFAELLGRGGHPHPLVYLRGVRHRHLAALLDFMYRGEVTVEQEALPAFLKTAEELRVKGLIERVEEEEVPTHPITPCTSTRSLDVGKENGKTPSRSKQEPTPTVKPARHKLTPKRRSNISEPGESKIARKESEPAPQAAPQAVDTEKKRTGGGGVRRAGVQDLLRAYKVSRGKVVEEVEEHGVVEVAEDRKEVAVVEDQEDATDETISEVERMLRETKAILGMERVRGPGGGLDETAKARTKEKKDISGNKGDVAEYKGGGLPPSTPAKAFHTSGKQLQVISCLVTKLSSSHGWRCTVCRLVFPSKAAAEEHVGSNHVRGHLQ